MGGGMRGTAITNDAVDEEAILLFTLYYYSLDWNNAMPIKYQKTIKNV